MLIAICTQFRKKYFLQIPANCIALIGMPCFASESGPVAAGSYHTCALTTAGGVKCWGSNSSGQLGDDSTTDRWTPVDVAGLTGVTAVTAGSYHTCALTTAGGVKCWGRNSYGQLGDNSTNGLRLTPVDVIGLTSGVTALAAGESHTCALTTAGGVKCWGQGVYGELGNNSSTNSKTPVDVLGLTSLTSGVKAIAAGNHHTCALTTAGGIKCWGYNNYGVLGDNTNTNRLTPVDVTGLTSGVKAVAAGDDYTCALTTAGGVKCWGNNNTGQLGNNGHVGSNTPLNATNVTGLASGVTAIAAGAPTCALITAGEVKCWGDNGYGLGNNTISGVVAIAASWLHTCALTAAGQVKCWGRGDEGQLGDGSAKSTSAPVTVDITAPVPPVLITPEPGWWWNVSEGGRGYAIEIQNGTMFLAGFMYDDSGKAIWYASGPTKMVDSATYVGTWQEYGKGQTLTGNYLQSQVVNQNVGTIRIDFTSPTTGTLTLPNGNKIPIVRYRFAV